MSDPSIQSHWSSISLFDGDPQETAEWKLALESMLYAAGPERVRLIMDMLAVSRVIRR